MCCCLWSASHAQTDVTPFVPGSTLEGVAYYLPRTAVRITVVAEKTVTRPGDFNKYAERYLSLRDVPQAESTTWTIKRITMEPYGIPDRTKAYSIRLKGKTVAPLVGLSSDGILLSINTEAEEETLPALPKGTPAEPLPNPRSYMTQEMLSAGSTAKMAELCAQEIYDIRESRNALVRGEADNTPKDGEQLKLMLEQLDKQASVLESLFRGTTQTSTEVFTLNYSPSKETERDILLRFSQHLGAVDADNLSGEPIYVSVKSMETLPEPQPDELVAKKKEKMERGVYYNVPARVKLTIFSLQKKYAELETPMGQFGTVEILSNTLFDKKTTTKVTFFQTTGGTKDVME
ncbi:MAG: DUF4831 family protein [Bacteroidaceae bacterium]|nr:DUF4831 family protein [Bacteroidaceae bacterium]